MGIALVVEAGDGEIDVMPETDVTAKTVLGEPAKGSADQSDLQDIGGLLGRERLLLWLRGVMVHLGGHC